MAKTTTGTKSISIPQIDKVRGNANFHTWRSMSITLVDIMGVWDIVSGKTTKPADLGTSPITWMRSSQRAKGFLLLNGDKGLMPLISSAPDATIAWNRLEEKFDRRTTTTLRSLMNTILTLRCSNKREIAPQMEQFDELSDCLLQRTNEASSPITPDSSSSSPSTSKSISTETLETLLVQLVSSPIAKGAFSITSLPTSLDNGINNLTTSAKIILVTWCAQCVWHT